MTFTGFIPIRPARYCHKNAARFVSLAGSVFWFNFCLYPIYPMEPAYFSILSDAFTPAILPRLRDICMDVPLAGYTL